jgi:molybdenum cofactor cytidylyltransferase
LQLHTALRLSLDPNNPDVVTAVGGGGKTSLVFGLAAEISAMGKRVITATTTRVTTRQLELAPAHVRVQQDAMPWNELELSLDEHLHCLVVGNETLLNGKQAGVMPEVIDMITARAAALGVSAILVEGDGSRTLPVKAPAEHEPVIPSSATLVAGCIGLDALGMPLDESHTHRPERIRSLLGLDDAPTRLTPAMAAALLTHPNGGARNVPSTTRLVQVLNKADSADRLASGRVLAELLTDRGHASLITMLSSRDEPARERNGPVAAIVLAAGESVRFGSPKVAALVEGETLAHRAVRLALHSGAQRVVVVSGAHAELLETSLGDLTPCANQAVTLMHNPNWRSGQASSLRTALASLSDKFEAMLFLPVDQPWVDIALLRNMLQTWRSGAALVAVRESGRVRGAPALFDRAFLAELAMVEGDRGGRSVLAAHEDVAVTIDADAATLVDVDRPEDLHFRSHA